MPPEKVPEEHPPLPSPAPAPHIDKEYTGIRDEFRVQSSI